MRFVWIAISRFRFMVDTNYALPTHIWHASDAEFLQLLYFISTRVPTQDMIHSVLGDCFVTQEEAEALIDENTMVLCSHRDKVRHYNNLMAQRLFPEPGQLHTVPLYTNPAHLQKLARWANDRNFHQLPCVASGAKVILTQNLEPYLFKKGANNGAMGTVTHVAT
jgi:hypothetical protein